MPWMVAEDGEEQGGGDGCFWFMFAVGVFGVIGFVLTLGAIP